MCVVCCVLSLVPCVLYLVSGVLCLVTCALCLLSGVWCPVSVVLTNSAVSFHVFLDELNHYALFYRK